MEERGGILVASIVEKMVEERFRWFEHIERKFVGYVVRRVDQIKHSHITRGKGIPRLTIRETIRNFLEITELNSNIVYDITLRCNLIHVADST